MCSLRIACNTRRKDNATGEWVDKPNYFDVTVWGAQGENCARYLVQGPARGVDGRLEWREWADPGRPEAPGRRDHRRLGPVPRRPRRRRGMAGNGFTPAQRRPGRRRGLPGLAARRRPRPATTTSRSRPRATSTARPVKRGAPSRPRCDGSGAPEGAATLELPQWRAARHLLVRPRKTTSHFPGTHAHGQAAQPATGSDAARDKKGGPGSGRRKSCPYCRDKIDQVDYKDVGALRRFISERGKIRSRRITGACRRHQRQIARAVKRARELALLPYVADVRESRDGRGDRGSRARRGTLAVAQAILLQDVEQLGERGEVVDVASGYLRNYLIPRKLAQPSTPGAARGRPQAPGGRRARRRRRRRSAPRRTPSCSAAPCSRSPSRPARTVACSARSPRRTSSTRSARPAA